MSSWKASQLTQAPSLRWYSQTRVTTPAAADTATMAAADATLARQSSAMSEFTRIAVRKKLA